MDVTTRLETLSELIDEARVVHLTRANTAPNPADVVLDGSISFSATKRKASPSLEHGPAKKIRASSEASWATNESVTVAEDPPEKEQSDQSTVVPPNEHEIAVQVEDSSKVGQEVAQSETYPGSLPEVEQLRKRTTAQSAKILKLQQELAEMKEGDGKEGEREDLAIELAEVRKQKGELQCKYSEVVDALTSGAVSNASKKAIGRKHKASIDEEWEEKMGKLKRQHESRFDVLKAKYQATLDSRQAAFQKRVDDLKSKQAKEMKTKDDAVRKKLASLQEREAEDDEKMEGNRAKCRAMVRAAKQREQDAKSEAAEEKRKAADYKKELRAEQLPEINKLKPAFSSVVTEKDKIIEELKVGKAAAEDTTRNTQAEVSLCNEAISQLMDETAVLEQVIKQNQTAEASLRQELGEHKTQRIEMSTERARESECALKARTDEKRQANERLQLEGRRWQKQYEIAQNLNVEVIKQQRAIFEMRGVATIRDRRILALTAEIEELKVAIARGPALDSEMAS
ncbi:hypothetical protein LTR53_000737 [Teratosphaeriaceae sp. CCFEE 6253]|nr:hypothetical protein LTR53_000737 [Teratosphaeriaceae sp. CCFEE 6253]